MTTIVNPAPARELDSDIIPLIDILILNESEASVITQKNVRHIETASRAADDLIERGIKIVLITLGRGGVIVVSDGINKMLPGNIVDVEDVTGAGDSFIGAFVSSMSRGGSILEAAEFANYAAAITVSKLGGMSSLPDRDEIENFICERKAGVIFSEKQIKSSEIEMLEDKSRKLRRLILEMLSESGSGHPGGSLSIVEIMSVLYFKEMLYDPENPKWYTRDRFVLSKGHACPALYGTLALAGFFDMGELKTLRKMGSILQGHPDMRKTPGVDFSTGSLGQGLSAANGMAIGFKMDGKRNRVYCILGD
ncbi:MAG: bifunctional hydroxymethylpyrimidine kinase/phosphomethylpyrimidine kinase, partial [Actinomycetia bacterium]|nr:bifunctional hydroxymethylpyrimidine kinase/phosphomethylpyrimidine kinase [Actinomycetes bacterium]